jgi:hypothetical protein
MKRLLVIAFLVIAPLALAEQADIAQAYHTMRLFDEACFKNSAIPQRVAAWAKYAVLPEFTEEQAKPFLPRADFITAKGT